MMKPILVDIPDDLRERLRNLKEATSLPVNEIIRRAVVFYLDHPTVSPNNTYREHGQGSDDQPPAGVA